MPHVRESLFPYALRLAEANGYLTPGYFLKSPTSAQFMASRHKTALLLQQSTGLSDAQMDRLSYVASGETDGMGNLLGQRVSLYDLQVLHPRICPTCVDENGLIEGLWDLTWITACPVHARKLLDVCPTCDCRFTWSRPGTTKCPRGHDVSSVICEPATQEEVDVARFLARKLLGDSCPDFPSPPESHCFSQTPVYETCRLAAQLIGHLSKLSSKGSRSSRGRLNLMSRPGAMSAVHQLLIGSPSDRVALFEALSMESSTGTQHRSFHAAFHWLFTLFAKDRAVLVMAPLLEELFAFAADHWPTSRLERTSPLFQSFVVPSKWASVTAAAKKIRVQDYKIMDGIACGEVPHKYVSSMSNHNLVVPVAWVEAQAAIPKVAVSYARLRELFSFSFQVVDILREKRVFIPSLIANLGQNLDYDMRLLADRMLKLSPGEVNTASARDVTFRELMYTDASPGDKALLVMAILDGSLKPTGNIPGQMLPGLLLGNSEARQFLALQKVATVDDIHVREAARLLECREVWGLIQDGHLEVSKKRNSSKFVTKASVDTFATKYVSSRVFLRDTGLLIPKLLRIARLAGIALLPVQEFCRAGRLWFVPQDKKEALADAIPRFADHKALRAPPKPKDQPTMKAK